MTELEEIKKFWTYKYPRVDVSLWAQNEGQKYFGRMISPDHTHDFTADTIGQLINLGEDFLRKYR